MLWKMENGEDEAFDTRERLLKHLAEARELGQGRETGRSAIQGQKLRCPLGLVTYVFMHAPVMLC